MDSLLALAGELERRDADLARRLETMEQRQHQLDELRVLVAATVALIAALPSRRAALERDEAAAFETRARAVAAMRDVDDVERARARAAFESAERQVAYLAAQREGLDAEELRAEADTADASRRAAALGMGSASTSLAAVGQWASRERGALLVEHTNLVRERDAVVREASELLGSVLGEPFAATSAAGLRGRLERGL